MSVNFHRDESSRLVTLRLSGKVSRGEFLKYSALIDGIIAEHGTQRLLLVLHDFHGLAAAAFFEDLRFDFDHREDLERIAVVAEKGWQKGLARFFGEVNHGTLRLFDADVEDDAWDWVHEGLDSKTVIRHIASKPEWQVASSGMDRELLEDRFSCGHRHSSRSA
jgi:hypothetical protein